MIFSDGISTNGLKALESKVSLLKRDKVTIFAVGIDLSNNLPREELSTATNELQYMASTHPVSGRKLYFDIKDFDQVLDSLRTLPNVKCQVKKVICYFLTCLVCKLCFHPYLWFIFGLLYLFDIGLNLYHSHTRAHFFKFIVPIRCLGI